MMLRVVDGLTDARVGSSGAALTAVSIKDPLA